MAQCLNSSVYEVLDLAFKPLADALLLLHGHNAVNFMYTRPLHILVDFFWVFIRNHCHKR